MRTSSTFSILFWIYSKRTKNDQAPLYARITVNGKKLNISLKRKINVKLWNADKQRAKGTSSNSREINQYISEIHSQLFQCFQELRTNNKRITPQMIKSKYFGEEKIYYTMCDIIEYHNTRMFEKLRYNTSRLYLISQKYILLFLKKEYNKNNIELSELDYDFILKFEIFLRQHKPRHYQPQIGNNAALKHIQRLRKMVTLAFHIEWIDRDPFVKFKQKLTPTERGFLTAEELQKLENTIIETERLKAVRDLFVFSCYTGIAYCDLMLLNKSNIIKGVDNNYWIVTKRQKNGNPIKIPLLGKAHKIISKYDGNIKCEISNTLLPPISNQKVNSYLKEIAISCEINKNVTFHMARHTFATTVTLTNGVPIETVSKMLGHNKLSTTQIYAKVIERKVSDDMEILRKKLEG